MNTNMRTIFLALVTATTAVPVFAVDEKPLPDPQQQVVRGRDLMTSAERLEHRKAMSQAKSPEERRALRQRMHAKLAERARQQGATLPDLPRGNRQRHGMRQAPEAPTAR